jgi:hypothetical protein
LPPGNFPVSHSAFKTQVFPSFPFLFEIKKKSLKNYIKDEEARNQQIKLLTILKEKIFNEK